MRRVIPILLLLAACGPSSREVKSDFVFHPDAPLALYFPLAQGAAWSYDVTDEATGDKLLLVNHIDACQGSVCTLVGGDDPLSYEDRGDKLVRLPSGTTVLQHPLSMGATWDIPDGKARITSVSARVETTGHVYTDCLTVEETTDERRVVTTYAPSVGPVLVEIYARGPAGERLDRKGVLRSYHKPGEELN